MKDFVLSLHPKVVLFLIGGNDAALAYEGDVIEDEGLRGHQLDWNSPLRLYREIHTALNNHSEVLSLASDLHRSLLAYRAGLNRTDTDFGRLGCLKVTEQRKAAYLAYYGSTRFLDAYKQRVNRLIDLLREAGMQSVLVTQPSVLGPVTDDVTGTDLSCVPVTADTNGGMVWELTERYNDVTREVGREANVPVIDLARSLPKSSRYYYDFYHYTNLGSERVADIVYESLCPVLRQKFPAYVREGTAGVPPLAQSRGHAVLREKVATPAAKREAGGG